MVSTCLAGTPRFAFSTALTWTPNTVRLGSHETPAAGRGTTLCQRRGGYVQCQASQLCHVLLRPTSLQPMPTCLSHPPASLRIKKPLFELKGPTPAFRRPQVLLKVQCARIISHILQFVDHIVPKQNEFCSCSFPESCHFADLTGTLPCQLPLLSLTA